MTNEKELRFMIHSTICIGVVAHLAALFRGLSWQYAALFSLALVLTHIEFWRIVKFVIRLLDTEPKKVFVIFNNDTAISIVDDERTAQTFVSELEIQKPNPWAVYHYKTCKVIPSGSNILKSVKELR